MEDQSRQHLTSWSCLGLSKQFLSGERIQASLSMYETSSMCREVMRTANTFPPLGSATEPLLHVPFVFRISKLQRTPSGQQKTEAGF